MKLRHELPYDAAPDAVLAMLTDTAYWEQVAAATGALSITATTTPAGDGTKVVVDQTLEVEGVPAFAKKFVGESTRAINTFTWNGLTADFVVDTPGKPTSMSGTATISAKGAGSVLLYDLEVKASVPLVGGKIEKLVAERATEGFGTENTVGTAYLAGGV